MNQTMGPDAPDLPWWGPRARLRQFPVVLELVPRSILLHTVHGLEGIEGLGDRVLTRRSHVDSSLGFLL